MSKKKKKKKKKKSKTSKEKRRNSASNPRWGGAGRGWHELGMVNPKSTTELTLWVTFHYFSILSTEKEREKSKKVKGKKRGK
jgi:hypothetical protein